MPYRCGVCPSERREARKEANPRECLRGAHPTAASSTCSPHPTAASSGSRPAPSLPGLIPAADCVFSADFLAPSILSDTLTHLSL